MLRPFFAFLFFFGLVAQAPVAVADSSSSSSSSSAAAGDQSLSTPTHITNQNTITVGNPATSNVGAPFTPVAQPLYAASPQATVAIVSAESVEASDPEKRIALIPMVGGSGYVGRWRPHVTNDITVGLILEAPLSRHFSFEAEGSYARHVIGYSYSAHPFDLFGLGANGKLYLVRGVFNPYIGGGLAGFYYNNMSRGPAFPYQYYDHWLGSGQLMVGGDIALSRDIAIGVRGAYLTPLFNQPANYSYNGWNASPGFEDAAAISTSFYRLLGTLRVSF